MLDDPNVGSLDNLHKISKFHNNPENMRSAFTYETTRAIIIQLVASLSELSHINFSHGDPTVVSLVFNEECLSYKYDGVPVKSEISLKLVNMWNSSAVFNNNHYFSKDVKSEMYLDSNSLLPDFDSFIKPGYYRLRYNNINIFKAMNHSGISIFSSSFDLYCFLISLMCDKSFHAGVMKNQKLCSLWKSIWLVEELDQIDKLINEHHMMDIPVNNFDTVCNIIVGFWLQYDVVHRLWTLIKKK